MVRDTDGLKKIIFKDEADLQMNLVNQMNEKVGRNFFKMRVTEKYVTVKCVPGCVYNVWFISETPLNPKEIKLSRLIQANHTVEAHIAF